MFFFIFLLFVIERADEKRVYFLTPIRGYWNKDEQEDSDTAEDDGNEDISEPKFVGTMMMQQEKKTHKGG